MFILRYVNMYPIPHWKKGIHLASVIHTPGMKNRNFFISLIFNLLLFLCSFWGKFFWAGAWKIRKWLYI
jgi:hypothetical protein